MKFIKISSLTFLLILVSMLVVACGNDQSTPGSSAAASWQKLDPCALLTKDQAAQVLGLSSVDEPTRKDLGPSSICHFGTREDLNSLSVGVFDHPSTKSEFETQFKLLPDAVSISGLGDAAFYGSDELNVLKGDNYIAIVLVYPGLENDQQRIEKLKQVANQILPKL